MVFDRNNETQLVNNYTTDEVDQNHMTPMDQTVQRSNPSGRPSTVNNSEVEQHQTPEVIEFEDLRNLDNDKTPGFYISDNSPSHKSDNNSKFMMASKSQNRRHKRNLSKKGIITEK